jgi:hypothetical protein
VVLRVWCVVCRMVCACAVGDGWQVIALNVPHWRMDVAVCAAPLRRWNTFFTLTLALAFLSSASAFATTFVRRRRLCSFSVRACFLLECGERSLRSSHLRLELGGKFVIFRPHRR